MTATTRVTPPDQGIRYEMIDGAHIVKAGAEDTGGAFEVFEVHAPKAPAAPPHRSPWTGTLYLLQGSLDVHVDGERFALVPGSTIVLPAGSACTFEVTSDAARFLAVTTGGGAGRLFADFDRTVPTDRPLEEVLPLVLEVTRRNGVIIEAPARS